MEKSKYVEYFDEKKKIENKSLIEKYEKFYDFKNQRSKQSLIFFDECETLAKDRRNSEGYEQSLLNTLLICLNSIKEKYSRNTLIVFATNNPMIIDDAVLSRISNKFFIKLPDQNLRTKLLNLYFKDSENDLKYEDYVNISKKTEGYSGRDLKTFFKSLQEFTINKYLDSKYKRKNSYTGKYTYCDNEKMFGCEEIGNGYIPWEDPNIKTLILYEYLDGYLKDNPKNIELIKEKEGYYQDFANGEDKDEIAKKQDLKKRNQSSDNELKNFLSEIKSQKFDERSNEKINELENKIKEVANGKYSETEFNDIRKLFSNFSNKWDNRLYDISKEYQKNNTDSYKEGPSVWSRFISIFS